MRLTLRKLLDALVISSQFTQLLEAEYGLRIWIALFEALVWFPRLQDAVAASSSRGMSAEFRGMKVKTWVCAGRCMIQFERGGHRVTLITADDEKPWRREESYVAPKMGPMGLQSIDADDIEANKMLYEATRWGHAICLKDDDSVTIA